MRASKKSTLNLTPLLDVILILLFVFMIMLATQQQKMANETDRLQQEALSASEQMIEATDENTSLVAQLALLEMQVENLQLDSSSTKDQLEHLREQIEDREESVDNAAQALAEYIGANRSDIDELLASGEAEISQEVFAEFADTHVVTDSLLKYNALSKQFYFIDVELRGSQNRVYINDKSTSVGISLDEVETSATEDEKIEQIKILIEEELEGRQGGAAMTFITLKVHDDKVYQYAWEAAWEAIGQVQEKYGTENVFRAHVKFIK